MTTPWQRFRQAMAPAMRDVHTRSLTVWQRDPAPADRSAGQLLLETLLIEGASTVAAYQFTVIRSQGSVPRHRAGAMPKAVAPTRSAQRALPAARRR